MTDTDKMISDQELEDLFRASRADPFAPSDDFMARLAADAAREQPVAPAFAPPPVRARQVSLWDRVSGWIPRMAWPVGLVTAGLTGIWIGAGSGPMLNEQTQAFMSSDLAYELAYRVPSLTPYLGGE